MRFHNRAIDQIQTVARFCRQSIENMLPDSSPRPAVEPIVRTRVRAVAFGQIAPRNPGPQHVKYCIYDPSIVRARALPTLRHHRLENRPFLIAEIESHDPPPPAVNHDPGCFSVNYAGTDPSHSCNLRRGRTFLRSVVEDPLPYIQTCCTMPAVLGSATNVSPHVTDGRVFARDGGCNV